VTESIFFQDNFAFKMFGIQHGLTLVVFTFVGYILIKSAKRWPKKKQIRVGIAMAYFLSFTLITWTGLKIYVNGFNVKEDLPLHLCNIVSLLLPLFAIYRKQWVYEVLLFWILAGTSQAMITPDLVNGFPHYHFLKYWIVHAGLVIFIMYATFIYGMRPTVKSIFKSFLALQGYFLIMLLINYLLGSNYLFISHKPEQGSLLDYLGDWPYYILMAELIVFPYFFLIYLPFHLTRKKFISQKVDPNF
jgi:hypothetical integral membrane protein (TIGR02206 family)